MTPQKYVLAAGALLACSLALSGCVTAAINAGTIAAKAPKRGGLQDKAEAGDAEAQYELGKSYCCNGPGFSTQTATEWLCQAAAQNFAPAQYELGRIYDGAVMRTPAPGQVLLGAATAKEDPVSAYGWFKLAADKGHEKSVERAAKEFDALTDEQKTDAEAWLADWRGQPCEYESVFAEDDESDDLDET